MKTIATSYLLTRAARHHIHALSRAVQPFSERLDVQFTTLLTRRRFDGQQISALKAITPLAVSRIRTLEGFLEEVDYQGRRLAKLNASPAQVAEALSAFDNMVERQLDGEFGPAREQLLLAINLTVNLAYGQVREAEVQALFGIYRAEADAKDLGEMLRRVIGVLTPALRARAGRIFILESPPNAQLLRPLYIVKGTRTEKLLLDREMSGKHVSFWSYPISDRLIVQFGFPTPYRWLPREMALLESAAERCRAAVARAELESENRRLVAHSRQVEEDERARISRELHDEVGQSLLLLRLQLEMLEAKAPPALRGPLREARSTAESAILEARRIMSALSSSVLERLGLSAALRQVAARFSKTHRARIDLKIRVGRRLVPQATQDVIYRVVQESLSNVAKHSNAKHVTVSLTCRGSRIRLLVADDGTGMEGRDKDGKFQLLGLIGMRERAAGIDGTLDIQSTPLRGFTVRLDAPLAKAAAESRPQLFK